MDKSKQHWQKVQERKRKAIEKESAEFDSFTKTMDSYMRMTDLVNRDCSGIAMIFVTEHMQESEHNND